MVKIDWLDNKKGFFKIQKFKITRSYCSYQWRQKKLEIRLAFICMKREEKC